MLSLGEVIDRYASGDTTEMDITVILMERAIGGDRQRLGDELWTEIVDDLVESPSRMMLSMGDRAVGADDFDLAVACYTAHVRAAEPDAAILAQTGRFLLTRVGASLCPMSPSDFEKDPEFEIYGDVPFEIRAGVLFPSDLQEPILELGVEAFARAIELLELVDDLDKWNPEWDELVQALLALDGLRCGLLMLGRLVDLDPVLAATFELCDLWEEEGPPSFSAVFRERTRETSAWLKGVRGQHFGLLVAKSRILHRRIPLPQPILTNTCG